MADTTTRPCRTRAADEEGQTLVEYVLVVGIVSVAFGATLAALTGGLQPLFTQIIGAF